MEQQTIHSYLQKFFELNECELKGNDSGVLTVKLNEELDRLLLNRPFYWEYIKKIGQEGEPATLTFITNPDKREEKGEWIHFGSPRLHQIFQYQLKHGKFTMLYEQASQAALNPWLVANIKISYIGQQKKDEILSIGLHLISGVMVFDLMEKIKSIHFHTIIPDYCFTISPIIKIQSGYRRIEGYIRQYLDSMEHQWAEHSYNKFQQEKEILTHFYESYLQAADEEEQEQLTERYDNELDHLKKRLLPKIHIEPINGGLFYMSEETEKALRA
ncbi:YqhG family protein [Salinibacillus aidingensis]|uniref:YqhG family protein n=1 Tax=Salinibacillus aidingensis TaxID=237684 RepID=A0ABN1ARE2_9BACI